jgi:ABC-type multidrug transport system permease subunit
VNALLKLTWNSIKISWRTPIAFFFVLLFPLGFFFVSVGIFAHGKPDQVVTAFGAVLSLMALVNGLFGNGAMTVMMRERGMLRPYHLTPLTAWQWMLSRILSNYLQSLGVGAVMYAIARTVYRMPFPSSLFDLWVVYTFGSLAIACVGTIVASIMNNMQESQIVFQILFFVFLFFSGSVIPLAQLPPFLRAFGRFLPPTLMILAYNGLVESHEGLLALWPELLGLATTGALTFAVAALLFRWEKEERATRRERLLAFLAFVPMILVGVWLNGFLR